MKKMGKILSILLIAFILVFSIISVFGYSYYVGDNKTTVIRGFDDLSFSTDINGGVKVELIPSSIDEAYNVADVITKRATSCGLKDYSVYVQDESKNVALTLPEGVICDFDSQETAAYLTSIGYVTLRYGYEYAGVTVDSSGNPAFLEPTGDILLNSSFIEGAKVSEYKDSGETHYQIDVEFNTEGKTLLSQLSDPLDSAGISKYNEIVSLWIDDRMVSYTTLSEHITDGVISFSDTSFTESKTELYASIINVGVMPCNLILSRSGGYSYIDSLAGNSPEDYLLLTGTVMLIIIAFILVYRYRAGGGIILVSVFFQFSVLLAFFTKLFSKKQAFMMNIPAFAAYALSVILTVLSLVFVFERIRKDASGTKISTATITNGYKSARGKIFDINIVFILISVSALIMFGTNGFAVSLFGYSMCGAVYRFADVMLFGSMLNFISGYLLPAFLTKHITQFRFFQKPSMLGGKK